MAYVKCYSEVSTKRYWEIKEYQTNESTKDSFTEKKESMEQRETMFDRILNAALSEVSTNGVTQENLELSLSPHSLDSNQTQNKMIKFLTDPTFLLPWSRTHPLGR